MIIPVKVYNRFGAKCTTVQRLKGRENICLGTEYGTLFVSSTCWVKKGRDGEKMKRGEVAHGLARILDRCFPMMVDVGLKFIVSESCFFIKIEMPSSGGFFVIVSKWEIQIMILQSYEAIYEHGEMKWLGDKPPVKQAHVIVT